MLLLLGLDGCVIGVANSSLGETNDSDDVLRSKAAGDTAAVETGSGTNVSD